MNYKLENLPPVWCVDVQKEKDHPRLDEFKRVFTEKKYYDFNMFFYGCANGSLSYLSGSNNKAYFQNKAITLDTFFALIDPLRLEEGNWLCCKKSSSTKLTTSKLYPVKRAIDGFYLEMDNYKGGTDDIYIINDLELASKLFRNATPEEIKAIETPAIAKVSFQKNETVLVRDSEDEAWQERLFIIEHEGLYYCAVETHAGLEPFKFIKPFEKPDELRIKLDELIKEYEQKGIRLIPAFEPTQ